MNIIPGMARVALCRCTYEKHICVAFFAWNSCMLAIKCKEDSIVIKGGWLPANRGVAALAIVPKLAGVNIIIRVAGGATRRCVFKLFIGMTTAAIHRGVLSL